MFGMTCSTQHTTATSARHPTTTGTATGTTTGTGAAAATAAVVVTKASFPITVVCRVTNNGAVAGDEVVQIYHSAGKAIRAQAQHPVPIKALVDFQRVSVQPQHARSSSGGGGGGGGWGGAVDSGNMEINTEVVSFSLDESAFGLVNATGDRVLYTGERSLIVSRGTGTDVTLKITIE